MQTLVALPPVLTPWQMVLTADAVVQVVMAVLLLASLPPWRCLTAKSVELFVPRGHLPAALRTIRASTGLTTPATIPSPAASLGTSSLAPATLGSSAGLLLEATWEELRLS